MSERKTLHVPHLGGIEVGYRLSASPLTSSKPTLVMIIPFTTTVDYYSPEFNNRALTDRSNLLAVEVLGHGATHTKSETWTYWDSAIMALQLLEALNIKSAFAMGTSQGGWIATRMALLAPEKIKGLVLIGTSLDAETPESRELGCWDGPAATSGFVKLGGDFTPQTNFEPGEDYYNFLMDIGYGKTVDEAKKAFWVQSLQSNYRGDEGKRRICMSAICLASRDGLYERLPYVRCPVIWLQGSDDVVFSVKNAEKGIKYFTNTPEAKLVPVEGGVHFLSFTHEKVLHDNILRFIERWEKGTGKL